MTVDPRIAAFIEDLFGRTPPPGVSHYVRGDLYRGPEDQAEMLATGRSRAAFGESAHNVLPVAAVDVWPIVGGVVANDPAAYQQIGAVARAHGLVWGGDWRSFKDYGHVEVPDWRDRAPAGDDGGPPLVMLAVAGLLLFGVLA